MIKIKQKAYTHNDAYCLAASLASILENKIDDYPPLPNIDNWYLIVNNYLHTLGYNLILVENPHISALRGYHLIIGFDDISGKMHCVVGKDGTMIHDPSSSLNEYRRPLENIRYGIISKLFF